MCLIHDFAESIVGDLTPVDPVTKEEKVQLENVKHKYNFKKICNYLKEI